MTAAAASDFSSVSERPGNRVTAEAVQMLYTRYARAAGLAAGKDVLEVACGPGHGLGLLARQARRVVGGDYTDQFVRCAHAHYGQRVPILRLDAQALPFADCSFDLLLLFEAIYYLPDAFAFLREARRILRPSGTLLICSANCEWMGFNPSPLSTRYFRAHELRDALQHHGFSAELFGAFPVNGPSWGGILIDGLRYVAAHLHLVPRTMAGKEFLKRMFYGRLHELGAELAPGMASEAPLFAIPPQAPERFKVLYAFGHMHAAPA